MTTIRPSPCCRRVLVEATRCGSSYAAAVAKLWLAPLAVWNDLGSEEAWKMLHQLATEVLGYAEQHNDGVLAAAALRELARAKTFEPDAATELLQRSLRYASAWRSVGRGGVDSCLGESTCLGATVGRGNSA